MSKITSRIVQGDYLDLISKVPDASVDLVLTDPPYGITSKPWDTPPAYDQMWAQLDRVIKPGGCTVLFASWRNAYKVIATRPDRLRHKYIWVKNQASGHLNTSHSPMSLYEEIIVFAARGPRPWYTPQKTYGHSIEYRDEGRSINPGIYDSKVKRTAYSSPDGSRFPVNVLHFNNVPRTRKTHPCEKPVDLLEFLIKTYCPPGGMVLDPFAGSGSTGQAAAQCGRSFTGFERDEGFAELAIMRTAQTQLTGNMEGSDGTR